jgi:Spy/CpxP family protein refolding chaperone
MKSRLVCLLATLTLTGLVMAAMSQPPDDKDKPPPGDKKDKKGFKDKKGPPPFELGKVLPPYVHKMLELSDEQEKQLREIEKDVKAKLLKLITKEQKERLKEIIKKGPKGPPKGKDRKPPKDDDGVRIDSFQVSLEWHALTLRRA